MRILIVTMTTLATTGALASTFSAAEPGAAGPGVTDLEVFRDGVTLVAAGSITGTSDDVRVQQVLVKARGVVKGDCVRADNEAPRRFAVPLVLAGVAATRRIGRGERTFFVRTEPPGLSSAEVCPDSGWSVAIRDVVFVAAKLQIGRGDARLVCQFPAVDGPVADPGCQLQR